MVQGSGRQICDVGLRGNSCKPDVAIERHLNLQMELHDVLCNNSLSNAAYERKSDTAVVAIVNWV